MTNEEKYRKAASTATETWTARANAEALDAQEAWVNGNAQSARNHATKAAEAAKLAEVAAVISGSEKSDCLARAAAGHAELATKYAEQAEAAERCEKTRKLLFDLLKSENAYLKGKIKAYEKFLKDKGYMEEEG